MIRRVFLDDRVEDFHQDCRMSVESDYLCVYSNVGDRPLIARFPPVHWLYHRDVPDPKIGTELYNFLICYKTGHSHSVFDSVGTVHMIAGTEPDKATFLNKNNKSMNIDTGGWVIVFRQTAAGYFIYQVNPDADEDALAYACQEVGKGLFEMVKEWLPK